MTNSQARRIAHRLETRWDQLRFGLRSRLGLTGTPMIVPFRGFGTRERFWVRGRVLKNKGVAEAPHSDSTLHNLWWTLHRYETDEVRGAELSWRGAGREGETVTDAEGYFDFEIEEPSLRGEAPWCDVELTLRAAPGYRIRPLGAKAPVRIVSEQARFGVISDIDDTIIKTGATNFLKHWRTVVANSAESRTPFPGVSHFYRALAAGSAGPETNPIFYVSSSPWNLFDLFDRFMLLHGIPPGPMLLRDFGLDAAKWFTGSHDEHKLAMIERILARFPALRFVLIGDSGQRDAAIYAEAVKRHKSRILAVHIHDVTPDSRSPAVAAAMAEITASGTPATISQTLAEVTGVALGLGLIAPAEVAEVKERVLERKNAGDPAASRAPVG